MMVPLLPNHKVPQSTRCFSKAVCQQHTSTHSHFIALTSHVQGTQSWLEERSDDMPRNVCARHGNLLWTVSMVEQDTLCRILKSDWPHSSYLRCPSGTTCSWKDRPGRPSYRPLFFELVNSLWHTAHLVQLAKQGPNVGGIACGGGQTDTVQSGGDSRSNSVHFTLVKQHRRWYNGLEVLQQARVGIQRGKKSWHDVLIPSKTSRFYKRGKLN